MATVISPSSADTLEQRFRNALPLGIDEATAVLVSSDGSARVIGNGSVYLLTTAAAPSQCVSALPLSFESLNYRVLGDGDTLSFPGGASTAATLPLSIDEGVMTPTNPYQ